MTSCRASLRLLFHALLLLFLVSTLSFTSWNSGWRSYQQNMGGLLAPLPLKDDCLSRLEHHLFSKTVYTPSAHLISALRQYEALHRKCYKEAELLASASSNYSAECQFIVWIAHEGLGNRMLTLVSTFVYALVTKRVLLVDTDLRALFCEPFSDTSWLLPESFPRDLLQGLGVSSQNRFGHLVDSGGQCQIQNVSLPDAVYLHLSLDANTEDKKFFCQHEQELLKQVPWLFIRSNVYFVPGLYFMPSFRKDLMKMFSDHELVFNYAARYLLHPSNEVWSRTKNFKASYLSGADRLVGVQLRMFPYASGSPSEFFDQAWNCLLREGLLPNVNRTQISTTSAEAGATRTSTTVLTVSLNQIYHEALRDIYLKYPTQDGSIVRVFSPSNEQFQKEDAEHVQKALVEMLLLSMCDVLITSPRSTFGYIAHGLAGLRPWMLRGFEDTKVTEPVCYRLLSSEPCYLLPPPLYNCDCQGGKVPGNITSFVKPCLDDPTIGVQLIQDP